MSNVLILAPAKLEASEVSNGSSGGETEFKSVEECEKAVADQGNLVRQMKSGGTSKAELAPHVERLLALKKQLELLKSKGGASEVSNGNTGDTKALEEEITKQAEIVRKLKASAGGDKSVFAADLAKLLSLKQQLATLMGTSAPSPAPSGSKKNKKK
uniref:Methionine--tRNA ligase, cytoplasmic n=1 Tax=Cacopsylla melanoneura TaxID=428564 RepID=A0A8D8RN39_9HEMI